MLVAPTLKWMKLWMMVWLVVFVGCGGERAPAPPVATAPTSVEPAADEPVDPLEARRKALSEEMRELVDELEHAGRYDCCTDTPCKQCAFRTGGCRCGAGLRNGEPVCEECALMWGMGKGAEDVDPASVRSFLEAKREETNKARGICACGDKKD